MTDPDTAAMDARLNGPQRCAHCRNWLVWSRAGESWCEFCCDDGEDE